MKKFPEDRRITAAAVAAGLTVNQVRYIERLGLITPRFNGSHRVYGEDELARLRDIKALMLAGYRPSELQAVLRAHGFTRRVVPTEATVLAGLLKEAADSRECLDIPVETWTEYNTKYKLIGREAERLGLSVERRKEGDVIHVLARTA